MEISSSTVFISISCGKFLGLGAIKGEGKRNTVYSGTWFGMVKMGFL
jgi:hypothetical protein